MIARRQRRALRRAVVGVGVIALSGWALAIEGGSVMADRGPASAREDAAPVVEPVAAKTDDLNRGLVSLRRDNGNFVSWRLLVDDPEGVAFNLYREGIKVNPASLTNGTNYYDQGAPAGATYTVRPVVNGVEHKASASTAGEAVVALQEFVDVPLDVPAGGTTPTGEGYTYTANDASVGDLNGDGTYEIVLKWDPTNAKDNSQAGYTGNVYVDAYTLDGTRMWRIDLGPNIRAGAHYTQFQVFDYDGDGSAEVAMKTADGTIDGEGTLIGDANADYRNSDGYVLEGPEFLSIFNGQTGAAMDTVDYIPARGNLPDWGDDYGNRADRFLAGTAYLDGSTPSMIFSRGYYTRAVIAAWTWDGTSLSNTWTFDSDNSGSEYEGQGNHNLSIADVDEDGRDEIIFGAMAVDDNGEALYSTGLGHGDALHVGDFLPDRPGQEVWDIHESGSTGASLRDAASGDIIWSNPNNTGEEGPGRGVAADIYADSPGAEFWATGGGSPAELQNGSGDGVGPVPSSANFVIWWDGDAQRELLDDTHIDKYSPGGESRLLTGEGVASNNGTKATPALSADIMGDWREEVIWRTSDNSALRIYSTTDATDIGRETLMQDRQYRVAIAWQNTAYNQPPHPSFLTP